MMNDQELRNYVESLRAEIQSAYEESKTIEECEKLAAKFLDAGFKISAVLETADLDSRMRKRGVAAIRSAVRMEEIGKHDKKPTEGQLEDKVNMSKIVQDEQESYDRSDSFKDYLENVFDLIHEAHLYFRSLMKNQ